MTIRQVLLRLPVIGPVIERRWMTDADERDAHRDLVNARLAAPTPQKLRQLAEAYTAAWCSMDPARVAAHFAPNGSLTVNDGPPAVGREAITATAQGFYDALPDMQVHFDDLAVEGDRVEYHWTFTGTNTGPGGTGNTVRVSGYEEWTLDGDGLIAASHGHYDAAEYARQLAEGV